MRFQSTRSQPGTFSSTTSPSTPVNSRAHSSRLCATSRTASGLFFWLPLPRKNTVAADEIVGRVLHAVDPAPQLRDLVALQHFSDRAFRQVADHVLLVVVL